MGGREVICPGGLLGVELCLGLGALHELQDLSGSSLAGGGARGATSERPA